MKRRAVITFVCFCLLLLIAGVWAFMKGGKPGIPTTTVQQKEFVEYQAIRGELKAKDSISILAPVNAGDLQILTLLKSGTIVKKGDVIVEFDPTTIQRGLEQQETQLRTWDAQVDASKARARLDHEQKATDALSAEFGVERATLDVSKQEILSEIEAKETALVLVDSKQKFTEMKTKVVVGAQSTAADTESQKLRRSKALGDLQRAQRQLASLTVRTPADGMLTLAPNYRARSNYGENAPEFKAGDRAWGGATIAEIPDVATVRVLAHVDEIDRGALAVGQTAIVHIDAVPDRDFNAVVSEISVLGKPDFTAWPPPNNFDVILQLNDKDARLRPGMSANARIIVKRDAKALVIPTDAIFEKEGLPVVFVLHAGRYEERFISVAKRSSGEAMVVNGLKAGDKIALKDPTEAEQKQ